VRYPSFIEELRGPFYRRRLRMGIYSGYALAALFATLALVGQAVGLVPWTWSFYVLIAVKVATNTAALICLDRGRYVLETQGLNTVTDIVVMTGAIYFTGGEVSPLFPIYVILISVVALLSNLQVTLITAAGTWLAYSAMAVATHSGLLPQQPAPAVTGIAIEPGYLVTDLVYAALVLGVPTFYTSLILRSLARKRRELELRNAELIEAGKQKSQFMANVTHELRTPIHGICGLSELLETGIYGPMTDQQKKAIDSIRRSAKGQLQLVDELLTLSRAEVGKIELRPEELSVAEVVDGVVAAVSWMLGTRKVTLTHDVPDDLRMVTDRARLNQILINLVSNAAKFTPEGGRISVTARPQPGDRIAIEVADTGCGIPADQLDQIFEAFRQVDGSDEREFGGVGLGLSLVSRLTELLGGEIAVDSEVDVGTTFCLTLPRLPSAAFEAA
jgi:signal transduction histidine kinase